jgi:hypothetical protein
MKNRFRNDLNHLEIVHGYCRAFNLILKDCIRTCPKKYSSIVEEVSKTFAYSAKKSNLFKKILKSHPDRDEKILTIQSCVSTRWMSYSDCLDRILELRNPLKEFFNEFGTVIQRTYFSQEHNIILL